MDSKRPIKNQPILSPRLRYAFVTLFMLVLFSYLMPTCAFAADKETNGSGGVHKVVAELSDEQVRRLLIEELQKTGSYSEDEGTGLISKGIFSGMLARLENLTGTLYWRLSAGASLILRSKIHYI